MTVIGIIPAAASWARQAWVRYKITNRRIRVTSGIGGKEMSEIVYPDIVQIRTARRLFGDGDIATAVDDDAGEEFDDEVLWLFGWVVVNVFLFVWAPVSQELEQPDVDWAEETEPPPFTTSIVLREKEKWLLRNSTVLMSF